LTLEGVEASYYLTVNLCWIIGHAELLLVKLLIVKLVILPCWFIILNKLRKFDGALIFVDVGKQEYPTSNMNYSLFTLPPYP
jgi:hypothetical protein